MATYELLSSTRLPEPVHGVAFNPWDANELICVGTSAITFWLLQHHGTDTSFQVPDCWLRCFFSLLFILILFYIHWCFTYMYVYVRVLDPLELELQTFVSCHVCAGN